MPRKPRVDTAGFHHVLNRGVNRENIFLCDEDKREFLRILDSARLVYDLTVHAFCVMDNHYHLLLQTHHSNLSLAVRQINSKYAVYLNKRLNRVGPLWQGRFKSWYVFDERYLWVLIRYIEHNPIKTNLVEHVGEYHYVSTWSLANDPKSELLSGSLLSDSGKVVFLEPHADDSSMLSELWKAKYCKRADAFERRRTKPLPDYFHSVDLPSRNAAIVNARKDGYGQSQIARHLGLSAVAISRIISNESAKSEQFVRMRVKGLFWSYAPDIHYDVSKEALLIETVLKYADMDEIKILFGSFGMRRVKQVWEEKLRHDSRFKKLNYFLARVFFKMEVEAADFERVTHDRANKLRLLAGQN
ncbi:MAG: transposase [Desulfuromonadales bacterium]